MSFTPSIAASELLPSRHVRIAVYVALVATLGSGTAHAQGTAADGVRAVVRGDYASAVRILRPLAENPSQPDPLAWFFLAMLYQSGYGVGMDPFQACGLYMLASNSAGAVGPQAAALARSIHEDQAPLLRLCHEASTDIGNSWLATGAPPKTSENVSAIHDSAALAEGAAAFVIRDYQRAVNLLKPIAERWISPSDQIAQLLMGVLYENGLGVPRDPVRACALYGRSDEDRHQGPAALAKMALFQAVRESLTME